MGTVRRPDRRRRARRRRRWRSPRAAETVKPIIDAGTDAGLWPDDDSTHRCSTIYFRSPDPAPAHHYALTTYILPVPSSPPTHQVEGALSMQLDAQWRKATTPGRIRGMGGELHRPAPHVAVQQLYGQRPQSAGKRTKKKRHLGARRRVRPTRSDSERSETARLRTMGSATAMVDGERSIHHPRGYRIPASRRRSRPRQLRGKRQRDHGRGATHESMEGHRRQPLPRRRVLPAPDTRANRHTRCRALTHRRSPLQDSRSRKTVADSAIAAWGRHKAAGLR